MYLFDKDHLPEEIMNDDVKFNETTYLLIKEQKLSAEQFDDYLKKYHKDISLLDFLEENSKLEDYFDDKDARAMKAMNSSYLRYYMRDLKKKVSFKKLSQNMAKRYIGLFIGDIIYEMCFLTCQNIFKEKYMELFEESVEEDYLHDEFDRLVIRMLEDLISGKGYEIDNKRFALIKLYSQVHAKYIVELNQEVIDEKKLKDYKTEIQNILSLSFDETSHLYHKQIDEKNKINKVLREQFIKKLEEETEKLPRIQQLNQEIKEIEEKMQEEAKKILISRDGEVNEDSIQEYLNTVNEDVIKEDYYAKQDKKENTRYRQIYQKYFMYDEDYLDDYMENVDYACRFMTMAKQFQSIDIYDYLITVFCRYEYQNEKDEAYQELEIKKDINEATELTCDFLNVLAYYLWHTQDIKQRNKRITEFQTIKDDIKECYQSFLELRKEDEENYTSLTFHFTPQDTYYNHLVMSVLLNIDEPAVARRVKRLILSEHQNNYNLELISQQLTQCYEVGINDRNIYRVSEMADLFIMSYIKDRAYIAVYSPFVRYFKDMTAIYKIVLGPYEEIMDKCFHKTYKDDLELVKKVNDISQKYDDFIKNYDEGKENLVMTQFYDLESLLHLVHKTKDFYQQSEDIHVYFEKYRYHFIWYLSVFPIEEDFFALSLEKQVDKFLCICFILELVQEIDSYEIYMPHTKTIETNEYIQSLKQVIEDQKHIIEIKEQQLEDISVHQDKHSKVQKNESQKLLEQELKYYKQEVSSLNKQLENKDKEITTLKQNEQELYKLRELIFQMQEDEIYEEETSIDLNPLLEEKTIITIGGHIHLKDKLKQKYPSIKTLSETSHIADSVFINADHVFIFHKFMNHGMYNRMIPILIKNNVPWDYIPYTNLEKTEKVIFDTLSRKE